jgi:hypothetical protein
MSRDEAPESLLTNPQSPIPNPQSPIPNPLIPKGIDKIGEFDTNHLL